MPSHNMRVAPWVPAEVDRIRVTLLSKGEAALPAEFHAEPELVALLERCVTGGWTSAQIVALGIGFLRTRMGLVVDVPAAPPAPAPRKKAAPGKSRRR